MDFAVGFDNVYEDLSVGSLGGLWSPSAYSDMVNPATPAAEAPASSTDEDLAQEEEVSSISPGDLIAGLRALAHRAGSRILPDFSALSPPVDSPPLVGHGKRSVSDLDSDESSSINGPVRDRPRRIRRSAMTEEMRQKRDEERLVHNRVSAKLSRERRKAYIRTLETQVQGLEQSKTDYESLIAHLMKENQTLQLKVNQLQNMLRS